MFNSFRVETADNQKRSYLFQIQSELSIRHKFRKIITNHSIELFKNLSTDSLEFTDYYNDAI